MKSLKMQPTFRLNVPDHADQAMIKIRRAIKSPELSDHVVSAGQCVDYKIETSDRRFWSPHLSVQLYDTESGAEVFGRFSPRPEIWTMFMAFYFAAAFTIFCALIYGYVQWTLGSKPWALILVPICVLIIITLHAASLIGQGLSSDQMQLLRSRLDRTMEIAFEGSLETESADVH
jgi:hypothetical protein